MNRFLDIQFHAKFCLELADVDQAQGDGKFFPQFCFSDRNVAIQATLSPGMEKINGEGGQSRKSFSSIMPPSILPHRSCSYVGTEASFPQMAS